MLDEPDPAHWWSKRGSNDPGFMVQPAQKLHVSVEELVLFQLLQSALQHFWGWFENLQVWSPEDFRSCTVPCRDCQCTRTVPFTQTRSEKG